MKIILILLSISIIVACNSTIVFNRFEGTVWDDVDTVGLAVFNFSINENVLFNRSISCSIYDNYYYIKFPDSIETYCNSFFCQSLKQSLKTAVNNKIDLNVKLIDNRKYPVKKVNEDKKPHLFKITSEYSIFYKNDNLPRYLISINDIRIGLRDKITNSSISNNSYPDKFIDMLETNFVVILWDYMDGKVLIDTKCVVNTPIKKNNPTKKDIDNHIHQIGKKIAKAMRI